MQWEMRNWICIGIGTGYGAKSKKDSNLPEEWDGKHRFECNWIAKGREDGKNTNDVRARQPGMIYLGIFEEGTESSFGTYDIEFWNSIGIFREMEAKISNLDFLANH